MYIPKDFEVTDAAEIYAFLQAHAFGQLVSTHEGDFCATHLPFLLAPDRNKLLCHVARQNPQWQDIAGQEVLVILQGPHDYISPSWYASPGVPTWNYQALHISGTCRVFHDTEKLKSVVDRLTASYEADFDQPWQPDYRATMLKAIVGIEIEIKTLQCKYKLSQNRSVQDQLNVIERLEVSGAKGLATAMRKLQRLVQH